MRLQKIRIKDYRILKNFSLDFMRTTPAAANVTPQISQEDYTLDLLVGVNGTGKSSLLRALGEIFQHLWRYEKPRFGFAISYQTQSYPEGIFISNLDEETGDVRPPDAPLRLRIGSAEEEPFDVIDSKYLPPWIVAFTSGSEQGWELPNTTNGGQPASDGEPALPMENNVTLKNWYLNELPGKPVVENRPVTTRLDSNFLFISLDIAPLVVLCGLLFDMHPATAPNTSRQRLLQSALQECKLKAIRGFSLKFRMNTELLLTEDSTFIAELGKLAHHTIQTGSDYLLVFSLVDRDTPSQSTPDAPVTKPEDLLQLGGGAIGLFRSLVRLQKPGADEPSILREVHLFLEGNRSTPQEAEPEKKSPLHLFDWLSDGEQSFLSRLCLLALLGDAEALVLLDEPEVHFNDYWKRQLVRMIVRALKQQERHCHVFMTTHSSITLTDVKNTDIWVLQREKDHTSYALPPALRTFGADPSDIMITVFGAENATGAQSIDSIEDIINLRADSSQERANKKDSLNQLLEQVGPSYWRFLIRREILALEGERQ